MDFYFEHMVNVLIFQCECEPPLKKQKFATAQPAALCVAVNKNCVAVGYHGDGIKLFSLDTGVFMCKERKKKKNPKNTLYCLKYT